MSISKANGLKEANRHHTDTDLLQECNEDVYYILELKQAWRQDSDIVAAEGDTSEDGDELLETRSMQRADTAASLTQSRSAKNTTWKRRTTKASVKLREVVGKKRAARNMSFLLYADVLISTKLLKPKRSKWVRHYVTLPQPYWRAQEWLCLTS